jgi:hypothetical protein
MTDPSTIETELRGILLTERPTEGASAVLRARVADIPARVRIDHPVIALLRRAAVPLSAVGAASAAVVLASIGLTRAPVTGLPPGGGGVSPGVTFDPALEGFGLVTSIVPTLLVVQWVIAGLAVAVAVRLAFGADRHARRTRLVASALVICAIAVAPTTKIPLLDGLGLQPGAVRGVLAGYGLDRPPERPFDEFDRYYQTASPGEPTIIMFSIRNAGPVPLRLEGVVVHPDHAALAQARWTAVWLQTTVTSERAIAPLGETTPFEPTTIAPGDELHVFLVGRAGPCAYGPGFTLESEADISGYSMLGPTVEVAYSFAGMVGTTIIDMDQGFVEPHRNGCNPA